MTDIPTTVESLQADLHPTEAHVNAIGWMRTWTGLKVTPLDMKPEMVNIADIAHALSRIARFGGHAHGFLSVAGHSVAVMHEVRERSNDPRMWLTALLHDASEAYIGDIVRPIKRHPDLTILPATEDRIHEVVASVFGTYWPHPPLVEEMDNFRLAWEMENVRDDPRYMEDPAAEEMRFLEMYHVLKLK